ncbi:MAG: O-methyltransferase [Bacteroidetes bacterium]|nr:O-methyltransferase [Bacteroidota bacterium]HET6244151.1 O-methyltransferase [Bacteroidia bacterium]
MEFLDPKLEEYVLEHTSAEPEILVKLNRETNAKILIPRMLSGHLQGRALSMFSRMINPMNILEIGTYTGYSAICLSEGLKEGGRIYTIDINEELEAMVRRYLHEAGVENKTQYIIGNALDVIPTLNITFDLVFIDADKENYLNYFNLVFDKVKPGGFLIADNVLWSGKVIDPSEKMDKDTKALMEFNKAIIKDTRVENVLFPIRDGLMIIRKK